MEPAIVLELALDLSGAPARITKGKQSLLWTPAIRNGAQDIERSRKRDFLRHRESGIAPLIIAAVQHEPSPGLDRPAIKNGQVAGHRLGVDLQLLHQFGEGKTGYRLVDDDAHGALRRMCAHVD